MKRTQKYKKAKLHTHRALHRFICSLLIVLLCTGSIITAEVQASSYGENLTGEYSSGIPFSRWKREREYKTNASLANFRSVCGGDLGKNVLFRSRRPDGDGKANKLADLFAEDAGVKYVINLYESDQEVRAKYSGSKANDSYYSKLVNNNRVNAILMKMKFDTKGRILNHRDAAINGFRGIAAHSGPYLVHCSCGKDRTGFFCMTAGALMGMSYDELLDDYMQSFLNVGYKSTRKGALSFCKKNLDFMLQLITYEPSGSDWQHMDLSAKAKRYLSDGGLSSEQIRRIKKNLRKSYPDSTRIRKGNYMLTVKLRDEVTGRLITTRKIAYGKSVEFPAPRKHDGYLFTGWSSTGKNINEDCEILACYKKS